MKVFVTGSTGFIGSAVVKELLQAGHEVVGLARSSESAKALQVLGARAHVGVIEDLEGLRKGAAGVDAAIHLAFYHKPTHASFFRLMGIMLGGSPGGIMPRFLKAALRAEKDAIETLGACLTGSNRALVVAAPTMALSPGRLGVETEASEPQAPGGPRGVSVESATFHLVAGGIRASTIRLAPAVHDQQRQGFVSYMMEIAKKKGISVYVGDGQNRWPAVHVQDTARLFRLAIEKGQGGARYHGVEEEGIPMKIIAEAIGKKLNLPVVSKSAEESAKHFSWLTPFIANDNPTSSKITQEQLGWRPNGTKLIQDIEESQ